MNNHMRWQSRRRSRAVVLKRVDVLLAVGLALWLLASATGRARAGSQPVLSLVKLPAARLDADGARRDASAIWSLEKWTTYQTATVNKRLELQRLLGPRMVSHRSQRLLASRGLGPTLLKQWPVGEKSAAQEHGVDTLSVLVVRISFASDRSGDLTSVTTDGNFQLRSPVCSDVIDPPPHNRDFFEAHLFGLSEFYRLQSGGRLVMSGRVLPDDPDGSYQLGDIADYGPGAGGFWTNDGLERLVRDMIAVSDSALTAGALFDPNLPNLADYDDDNPFRYVIFVHAGADWQSDINNDSPNDIPTFFVNLGDPEPLRGIDSQTGAPGMLTECSVIPETTTQDDFPGSIAAGLYHEFGHALGLVDIYSTRTGYPEVGVWDLMDSGTNLIGTVVVDDQCVPGQLDTLAVAGLLPPSLGAWEKWFLGWLELDEVAGSERTYQLPAVQVPREDYSRYRFNAALPQALVGGTSSREFFLVENRWVPGIDDSEIPEETGVGFVQDEQTGVILYLGGDPDPGTGLPRNTGLYDYFLPTLDSDLGNHTGLLIWHVNMDRIAANLATNTVNYYDDGLRLMEADGIADVGVLDPYTWGFGGSYRDPFNEENGDALYMEAPPSSRAFDRSWTGLHLAGIRAAQGRGRTLMQMSGGVAPLLAGSPWTVAALSAAEAGGMGGQEGPRALMPGSVTTWQVNGQPAIVLADEPGPNWSGSQYHAKLFLLDEHGAPLSQSPAADWPEGAAWEFASPLAGPPLLAERVGGPLLVGCQNGQLFDFSPNLAENGVLQMIHGPVSVGDSLLYAPVEGESSLLLFCVPPDGLVLLDEALTPLGEPLRLAGPDGGAFSGFAASPLALNPLGSSFDAGFAVFAVDGWYRVSASLQGLETAPAFMPYASLPEGPVHRAFMPDQNGGRLLVFSSQGLIGAWSIDAAANVTTATWQGNHVAELVAEPAVADLDGDGDNDLILLTRDRVSAFQADGVLLRGFPVEVTGLFPLPDTTGATGPLVICDATADGVNEIFFGTDLGHLVSLDATGRLMHGTPLLWGGAGTRGMLAELPVAGRDGVLWLLDPGGVTGPPMDRQWHDGRIIGYELAQAAVPDQGTAVWLGPGGGSHRRGPEGTLTRLPGPAPWQVESQQVAIYPNPVTGQQLSVRFFSKSARPAHLTIYNLEGEIVHQEQLPANAEQVNDRVVTVARLVTGLYVCQLEWDGSAGPEKRMLQLAVAR